MVRYVQTSLPKDRRDVSESLERLAEVVKTDPLLAKQWLAFQIVKEFHSEPESFKAMEEWQKVYQRGEYPDNIKEWLLNEPISLVKALSLTGLAKSNSDAKRLIQNKGVKFNRLLMTDPSITVGTGVLQVGKDRLFRLVLRGDSK